MASAAVVAQSLFPCLPEPVKQGFTLILSVKKRFLLTTLFMAKLGNTKIVFVTRACI